VNRPIGPPARDQKRLTTRAVATTTLLPAVTLTGRAAQTDSSVTPYVDQTHDCFHDSLTTCKGELASADVQVQIVDRTNDKVLVDETLTTFENGFTTSGCRGTSQARGSPTTARPVRSTSPPTRTHRAV
jgi:hypothetical protein